MPAVEDALEIVIAAGCRLYARAKLGYAYRSPVENGRKVYVCLEFHLAVLIEPAAAAASGGNSLGEGEEFLKRRDSAYARIRIYNRYISPLLHGDSHGDTGAIAGIIGIACDAEAAHPVEGFRILVLEVG